MLESFDKDLVSSDALGTSRPLDWLSFVHDEKPQEHQIDLYLKNKKSGSVKFTTQLTPEKALKAVSIEPQAVSPQHVAFNSAMVSLWKGCSTQHYDPSKALTEGLKASIRLKNEEHMMSAI